jgi:trigger factor
VSQATTDLQISVEEPAAWSRRLVITVPAARVRSERARVTRRLAKRVRIPGFRKGKVPPARLEAQFGPDIDRQTQQQVIDAAFREAVKAKSLEPISEPRVANVVYDRDSELTFEVAFDIKPEIKLARIGGFRLSRPEVTVSEEEIAERLEYLRRQQALWKPVERRPAPGDTVEVEITPLEGAEAEEPESRNYRFVLGRGQAIPEVEAAITTLEPGRSEEFDVRFPDDFPDESKQGTTQRLRIALQQVLEQELPPLGVEFARSLGDFNDLEALRGAISEDLLRFKQEEVELRLDQEIMEQIIEANPFDIPESMIERYVDALVGPPPDGADPDLVARARDEARPTAIWGIKRTLILQRVAEDQGFEASEEEVQERLQGIAARSGRPPGEVRARLAKTGELQDIKRRIVEDKVFGFLKQQSEVRVGGA